MIGLLCSFLFCSFLFCFGDGWFDSVKIFVFGIQIHAKHMVDTLFDHEDEKWLQEQQMLHNIQSNYCRELMDSIQLQFVFLDEKKTITHISSQSEPLQVCDVSNQCVLTEEHILALLENVKKQHLGKKFALHHISSFLVDLEPEHVQQFSTSSSSDESPFLRHFSTVQSIYVPSSIFIFHNVNTIYFFLHEIPSSHQQTYKSILKKKSHGGAKKTKRVRIQQDLPRRAPKEDFVLRNYHSRNGTRKIRP